MKVEVNYNNVYGIAEERKSAKELEIEALIKKVDYDFKNYSAIESSETVEKLKVNAARLKEMGWLLCPFSKLHYPPQHVVPFYESYDNFKSGKKSYTTRYYAKSYTREDSLLKESFQGGNGDFNNVFIKDQKHFIFNRHLEDLIAQGKVHSEPARVNRNTYIYTDFAHYWYDNKKAPRNWVAPSGETFGIEIEVNFPDALSKLKFSNELYGILPGWICERDGSLEDYDTTRNAGLGGLELISPPLNMPELIQGTKVVCEMLKKYEAKAHNAGEFFGLHVTHSLSKKSKAERDRQAFNYLSYINEPKLREFWRCISRRKPNKYCIFDDNFVNNYEGLQIAVFTVEYSRDNHHKVANVRNSCNQVETRMFRSTKGIKTIEATIEIIKLTNDFSLLEYDVNGFSNYIRSNMSKNLGGFLQARGGLYSLDAIEIEEYNDEKEDF